MYWQEYVLEPGVHTKRRLWSAGAQSYFDPALARWLCRYGNVAQNSRSPFTASELMDKRRLSSDFAYINSSAGTLVSKAPE